MNKVVNAWDLSDASVDGWKRVVVRYRVVRFRSSKHLVSEKRRLCIYAGFLTAYSCAKRRSAADEFTNIWIIYYSISSNRSQWVLCWQALQSAVCLDGPIFVHEAVLGVLNWVLSINHIISRIRVIYVSDVCWIDDASDRLSIINRRGWLVQVKSSNIVATSSCQRSHNLVMLLDISARSSLIDRTVLVPLRWDSWLQLLITDVN